MPCEVHDFLIPSVADTGRLQRNLSTGGNGQLLPVGGAPFALSGSRCSAILYRPPYGLTGWGTLHTGHEVVLRALTLHFPTNLPPPLHLEVIV